MKNTINKTKILISAAIIASSVALTGCQKDSNTTDTIETEETTENIQEESFTDLYYEEKTEDVDRMDDITSDLYDAAGNLLWEGIPEDKVTDEDREMYAYTYDEYMLSLKETTAEENLEIVNDGKTPKQRMSDLCIEYNEEIPFADGKMCYNLGYEKYEDGLDNRYMMEYCNTSFGMGSLGYVIWLYRNTYGYTPKGLDNPIELFKTSQHINNPDELDVGDICLTTCEEGQAYKIGVVAGRINNIPVVSLCDNLCSENFTYGSTRLAYIKTIKNASLNNSNPVDFQYFFRVELNDGEEAR